MIDFRIKQARLKNKTALDIGASFIKILEIAGPSNKPALVGFGVRKISESSKGDVSRGIKALVEESRISTREFNISVSGPFVIVRLVSMPNMKEADLRGAIRFEAEKFIPFNINDCVVDFQTLKKNERENRLDILLVAAKKEYIMERITAVQSAGFSVGFVDVDSFALTNSFLKNFPTLDPAKTFALINIGARFTNLSILNAGQICFVRDISIGSSDLDKAISRSLGIDMASAENLKISGREENKDQIAGCTRPVIANMLEEVKLSFSYYENQCGRSVDEIYVSGGGSYLASLDELFHDMLGSAPVHWNPLQFLDTSAARIDKAALDKTRNSFAISAGLAIR